MKQYPLISINVTTGSYQDFLLQQIKMSGTSSTYTCVANVHMLAEAHRDPAFSLVVKNADMITPDGVPLTWGLKILHGIKQERVAGMDLLPDLLKMAEEKLIPVYFYGGTDEMLSKADEYIKATYKNLLIAGMYSPPFRQLSSEENELIIEKINSSGAKLVFVVLGCPKQEKWMSSMKGKINAAMIGIGGALPVFVGMQKRAPQWMQNSGMEWLYRLYQEPKRLFKRYFVTNTLFIFLLSKEWASSRLKRSKASS